MSKEYMAVTDREKRLVELVEHLVETLNQCAGVVGAGMLMLRRANDAVAELDCMGLVTSDLADAIVASLTSAPSVNAEGKTVCNCEACRHARN